MDFLKKEIQKPNIDHKAFHIPWLMHKFENAWFVYIIYVWKGKKNIDP
jgi:hypothetical protein